MLRLTPGRDNPLVSQDSEMLGDRRHAEPQRPMQFADAALAVEQFAQNRQTRLAGHRLEQAFRVGDAKMRIF